MSEQVSSDQSATPKTDEAEQTWCNEMGEVVLHYVDVDFARAQERRIAELERRLVADEVTESCVQTALAAADRLDYAQSATATALKRLAAEVRRLRGEQS